MSAASGQTGRVTPDANEGSSLPVPQLELLASVQSLETALEELAGATGSANAWGMRTLRRNVALALERPETLASVENQLDFVEELAAAVWAGGDCAVTHAVAPGRWPAETGVREDLRRSAVTRLDEAVEGLCARVEAWRQREAWRPQPGSERPLAHRF